MDGELVAAGSHRSSNKISYVWGGEIYCRLVDQTFGLLMDENQRIIGQNFIKGGETNLCFSNTNSEPICFSHVNSNNLDYIFATFFNVKKLKRKTLTKQTPFKTKLSFSLSISLSKVES
jgi:hypothetical protein